MPRSPVRLVAPAARAVISTAIIALVMDVVFAAMCFATNRAFLAAPNNAFTQPEDDVGYVLTAFATVVATLLRDVALLVLAVACVRWLLRIRRNAGAYRVEPLSGAFGLTAADAPFAYPKRMRALCIACLSLVLAAVVAETVRLAVSWLATEPTAPVLLWSVLAAAVNAAAVAVTVVVVARVSTAHDQWLWRQPAPGAIGTTDALS